MMDTSTTTEERVCDQIDRHADTVMAMRDAGFTERQIAERLYDLGVRHPLAPDHWGVESISAGLRDWLRAMLSPLQRAEDKVARLEAQLAAARAELEMVRSGRKLPGRPSTTLDRNWQIYDRHQAGERIVDLLVEYNVSRERIHQIIRRCHRLLADAANTQVTLYCSEAEFPFVQQRLASGSPDPVPR